jgi:hypothetical protein
MLTLWFTVVNPCSNTRDNETQKDDTILKMLVPKTSYRCSNGYVYAVYAGLHKLLTFCSGQFHRQNHDRSAVPLSHNQQSPSSYQQLACKTCTVLMETMIILCLAISEHANPFIHTRLSQNTVKVQCSESTEFPRFL